jgi:hypothetical protein
MSATTDTSQPVHPWADSQLMTVEEATRILGDHSVESHELIASPWIGLHFKNEHL